MVWSRILRPNKELQVKAYAFSTIIAARTTSSANDEYRASFEKESRCLQEYKSEFVELKLTLGLK